MTVLGRATGALNVSTKPPEEPHLFFAGEKVLCRKGEDGLPSIESLVALVTHLTGKRPSELEILEARVELEVFLDEKAAEQAATLGHGGRPGGRSAASVDRGRERGQDAPLGRQDAPEATKLRT
jgi:hypothetical protein